MYDTQLKLIATTKMKGEQKEINKEKRKQEDEERNLKNDIPNALTGFLLNISILSPDWANLLASMSALDKILCLISKQSRFPLTEQFL